MKVFLSGVDVRHCVLTRTILVEVDEKKLATC